MMNPPYATMKLIDDAMKFTLLNNYYNHLIIYYIIILNNMLE